MPLRVGSTSVVLKLGAQSVAGRLGATLVTASVPGAPTITSAIADNTIVWSAPADNGGSSITGYKFYANGVWDTAPYAAYDNESFDSYLAGTVVEVSAVNAIGEGPKSAPVTVVVA